MVSAIDNVYRVTLEDGNIEYTLCPVVDEDINEHIEGQKKGIHKVCVLLTLSRLTFNVKLCTQCYHWS